MPVAKATTAREADQVVRMLSDTDPKSKEPMLEKAPMMTKNKTWN